MGAAGAAGAGSGYSCASTVCKRSSSRRRSRRSLSSCTRSSPLSDSFFWDTLVTLMTATGSGDLDLVTLSSVESGMIVAGMTISLFRFLRVFLLLHVD